MTDVLAVRVLHVADADAVAAACGVNQIDDMPWARDFETADPWGNRIRVGTVATAT